MNWWSTTLVKRNRNRGKTLINDWNSHWPTGLETWYGALKIKEVHQKGRWYTLENGRKVPYERLKLHFHNPNGWILLTVDDVAFVVNAEDTGSEGEIYVSEDAKSFRKEQASRPASEKTLRLELETPANQMMTRSKMAEGRGRKRWNFTKDDMGWEDFFEYSEKDFEMEPEEAKMDCDWDELSMNNDSEYPRRETLPIYRPQLVVSEEDSCDSNASTIPIGDRDILEWNDDHTESTLLYTQCDGESKDHEESTALSAGHWRGANPDIGKCLAKEMVPEMWLLDENLG